MVGVEELNVTALKDGVHAIRILDALYDAESDVSNLRKTQQDITELLAAWRSKQAEMNSQNLELQQQVALAERRLVSAKMDNLEECIQAIEEQMISIRLQRETLEKPDPEEAFLKNELSLFLNVSSILPDLGDPKFSGTFVDKQRGVKTFKFPTTEMSPFETCNAAWDMMR
ncbi:unnamed protein product [Calypogeia fissa]